MLQPLLAALLVGAGSVASFAADRYPFVMPWDDASPSITDLTSWNEKPAGRAGFIQVKDGHLFAGEKRLRIFGVNVCFGANFPDHDAAPKIAARMAKLGINCVRFHHMDSQKAPAGLFGPDGKTFDAERLDRLDFFIAQLKAHGIYADLNLHVSRTYPLGTGAKPEGAPDYDKGVDNFAAGMIALQKDYARTLLTHRNPYTGQTYTDEPAVAFIEINNENALFHEWQGGGLDRIAPEYRAELSELWTRFITSRHGSDDKLRALFAAGVCPAGPELLTNGDFSGGGTGWWADQLQGTTATVSYAERNARITVSGAAKEPWHAQFNHAGLSLEEDRIYTVRFRADVAAPEAIHVTLAQAHAPWQVYDSRDLTLQPGWHDYTVDLRATATDSSARLSLSGLARKAESTFTFADLSLRQAQIEGLPERDSAGRFPAFIRATLLRRTPVLREEWTRFLWSLEENYWPAMRRFLREELGAKSLVIGTQLGWSPFPLQQAMDVIDSHAYWQHPHFPGRPWDMNNWRIENRPMAGAETGGTLPALALQRVIGKPYICTEYNHAFPNSYGTEAFPLVCAYAALQDWDGVFAFAYSHRTDDWDKQSTSSFFDIDQDPVKLTTLTGALALFRRGDVSPARESRIAEVSLNDTILQTAETGPRLGAEYFGVQWPHALVHRVGVHLSDGEKFSATPAPAGPEYISDTAQLRWDTAHHAVTIETPRSVAYIGEGRGRTITLGPLTFTVESDWACLQATVIEGENFATARRILLTATAGQENTGMQWRDEAKTTVGTAWGRPPTLLGPVRASIQFPSARKWKAAALDPTGRPAGSAVAVTNQLVLPTTTPAPWYEITPE